MTSTKTIKIEKSYGSQRTRNYRNDDDKNVNLVTSSGIVPIGNSCILNQFLRKFRSVKINFQATHKRRVLILGIVTRLYVLSVVRRSITDYFKTSTGDKRENKFNNVNVTHYKFDFWNETPAGNFEYLAFVQCIAFN